MKITANGIGFETRFDGPQEAPVVVLSNSLATNLSLWDALVSVLAGRYRVFRYDQRGHGGTQVTPAPYRIPQLADDALALMDVAGIAKAHWVGISMGGVTGLCVAQKAPERLLSLAVCDAAPKSGPPAVWDERLEIVRAGGMAAIVEPTLSRWFAPASMAADTPAVQAVRRMIATTPEQGFVGCVRALQDFDFLAVLEKLVMPVLLVAGEHDGSRPKTMLEDAARIPGARTALIPQAGHLSNIENPTAFNAAVVPFLDGAS